MKLFDFGNSRYKYVDIKDLSTITVLEYDQLNLVDSIVAELIVLGMGQEIYAISVRPKEFNHQVLARYKAATGKEIHFLQYQPELLRINYANPQTFGIDRFAAMLGVQAKRLYPAIIVDAGTAVTIDVLDKHCVHLGGCILPGKSLMLGAMTNKSPALQYSLEETIGGSELGILGNSTQECMISGVANSIVGAILSVKVSLGQDYFIQVTGGDAQWVIDHLALFNEVGSKQPSLLFDGMKQMTRGQY